jgi:hypothetical protein
MPPQQPDRLLDLIEDGLNFRAHGISRSTCRPHGTAAATQPNVQGI